MLIGDGGNWWGYQQPETNMNAIRLAALSFISVATQAHAISIQPLMLSGEPAPGLPGTTISQFSLGRGMTGNGEVVVRATLSGATTGNAIVVAGTADDRIVARTRTPAVGGGTFSTLSPGIISVNGLVAFTADASSRAVFLDDNGVQSRILSSPLAVSNSTVTEVNQFILTTPPDAAGGLTIRGLSSASANQEVMIRRTAAGSVSVVLAPTAQAPGQPQVPLHQLYNYSMVPTAGNFTQVAARTSEDTIDSIYRIDDSGAHLLAAAGQPVGGRQFVRGVPVAQAPDGTAVFLGASIDALTQITHSGFISRNPAGEMQPILTFGEPVSSVPGFNLYSADVAVRSSSNSAVATMTAYLIDSNLRERMALIAFDPDGANRVVYFRGERIPGTDISIWDPVTSGDAFNRSIAINSDGWMVFKAFYSQPGPSGEVFSKGLWLDGPNSEPQLLAIDGTAFDFGDGSMRILGGTTDDPTFGPAVVNDLGQFAFTLRFSDGSKGAYILTVPEPATLTFAGTCLALMRRRTK